ncbi:MAG: hypothetical protein IPN86_10135 [Saprospiraceae bacterium]|nr:hypothetical protein [Saprospiraceae bacterium]
MYHKIVLSIFLLTFGLSAYSQFGYGFTVSNDLYHRYVNPKDNIASPSSGSAILNLGVGPKIWIGNKNFSFSAEAQAVVGFLAVSSKDNKGLGSIAFPMMGKLNFKGLSTFDKEGKMGFSLGGGIQHNKTELYGLSDEFAAKGVKRNYFMTYITQASYGFGLSGFTAQGFVRYGFNPDIKNISSLNVGLQFDFNAPMLKKITNPESEL